MPVRLVRMEFIPEKAAEFLPVFAESSGQIRAFPGCKGVKLLQDAHQPNVYYTLSNWDSLEALEHYRASALFRSTWAKAKALFSAKAQAYSMDETAY